MSGYGVDKDVLVQNIHNARTANDSVSRGELLSLLTEAAGGADPTTSARLTTLENNELKITYYASIGAATGTITIPTGATILLDEFEGADAYLSTLSGSHPTGDFPKDASNKSVDVATFDAAGNYTLTGTPASFPVALIYNLKIKAKDYANLTLADIVEETVLDIKSTVAMTLATAQTYQAASFPYPEGQVIRITDPSSPLTFYESYIVNISGNKKLHEWGYSIVNGYYCLVNLKISTNQIYRALVPALGQDISGNSSSYATMLGQSAYAHVTGEDIVIINPHATSTVGYSDLYNVSINFNSNSGCSISSVNSYKARQDNAQINFLHNNQSLTNGVIDGGSVIDMDIVAGGTTTNFNIIGSPYVIFNGDTNTGVNINSDGVSYITFTGRVFNVTINCAENTINFAGGNQIQRGYVNISGTWELTLTDTDTLHDFKIDRKTHSTNTLITEKISGCTWEDGFSNIKVERSLASDFIGGSIMDISSKFYGGIFIIVN